MKNDLVNDLVMFSNICSGKVRHYESLLKLLLLTRDLTLSIQRSYKLASCTSFTVNKQLL